MSIFDPVILEIPTGPVLRSELIQSLREMLAMAEAHQKSQQPGFVRFPDAHAMLDHIEEHGIPADIFANGPDVPRRAARKDDMSQSDSLELFREDDGDWIVTVKKRHSIGHVIAQASVQFCTPGSGGGGSTHTFEALSNLAMAMGKDDTSPTGRNRICSTDH